MSLFKSEIPTICLLANFLFRTLNISAPLPDSASFNSTTEINNIINFLIYFILKGGNDSSASHTALLQTASQTFHIW